MRVSKLRVEEIMTTDLHTVGPDEPVDLVGKVMEWKGVRHIPVENMDLRLVGLLTVFDVLQYLGQRGPDSPASTVGDLMTQDPPTVAPTAPIGVALAVMREQKVDCLPVVQPGNRLVGIVTERDFIQVIGRVFENDPAVPEPD